MKLALGDVTGGQVFRLLYLLAGGDRAYRLMMIDEARAFGALLRLHRRSALLSQDELAERSGLSTHAISGMERGRTRAPHRNSVYRLADALGLAELARAQFVAAAGRRLPSLKAGEGSPAYGRAVPRQLPAAAPGFVGRSEQLAALSRALNEPGRELVTCVIVGAAGIGKTALAAQWAHRNADRFPDGQLFINLRGLDSNGIPADDAVWVLLEALNVPADAVPHTPQARFAMYRSQLAGKRLLVLLDNARDAAQIRPLLPGSPTCRVIVTSRNQLTGLTAIDGAWPLRLDVLTIAEACDLLRQRLGEDRITGGLDARIAHWCDRLPLALSVVAARASAWPPVPLAAIAAELADPARRLDVLQTVGDQVASVRAALASSYDQLDADVARTFRLLGVHSGPGISLAETVEVTGLSHPRALRHLLELAEASLVVSDHADQYRLHGLTRLFAAEMVASMIPDSCQRISLTTLRDHETRADGRVDH